MLSLSWQRGLRGAWARPPCTEPRSSGVGGRGAEPGVHKEQTMGGQWGECPSERPLCSSLVPVCPATGIRLPGGSLLTVPVLVLG